MNRAFVQFILAFVVFHFFVSALAGQSSVKNEIRPGIFLDMNYNYVFGNGSYLIAPINGPVYSCGDDSTMGGDLGLGYQFAGGFAFLAGYEYLYRSEHLGLGYAASVGARNDAWTITEHVVSLEPAYRYSLSRRVGLLGSIKLGYSFEDLSYGNHYGGLPASSYSGTGLIYEPALSLQFLMGRHAGLNLKAGYRTDEVSQVTDARGRPLMAYNGSGNREPWRVVNSGLELSAGLTIYFKPMF